MSGILLTPEVEEASKDDPQAYYAIQSDTGARVGFGELRAVTREEAAYDKLLKYGFAILDMNGTAVILSNRERVAVSVLP